MEGIFIHSDVFALILLTPNFLEQNDDAEDEPLGQVERQQVVEQQLLCLHVQELDDDLQCLDLVVVEPLALEDGLQELLALISRNDPPDSERHNVHGKRLVRRVCNVLTKTIPVEIIIDVCSV